ECRSGRQRLERGSRTKRRLRQVRGEQGPAVFIEHAESQRCSRKRGVLRPFPEDPGDLLLRGLRRTSGSQGNRIETAVGQAVPSEPRRQSPAGDQQGEEQKAGKSGRLAHHGRQPISPTSKMERSEADRPSSPADEPRQPRPSARRWTASRLIPRTG